MCFAKLNRHSLLPKSLVTIHKVFFLRPLIAYRDIIYDQHNNREKLKSAQYQTLWITGVIQGTSSEKIFQESGIEPLKSRRRLKRLCCMFKIMKNEAPNYLIRTDYRKDSLNYQIFSSTLNDLFTLDVSIRNSISIFKSKL